MSKNQHNTRRNRAADRAEVARPGLSRRKIAAAARVFRFGGRPQLFSAAAVDAAVSIANKRRPQPNMDLWRDRPLDPEKETLRGDSRAEMERRTIIEGLHRGAEMVRASNHADDIRMWGGR